MATIKIEVNKTTWTEVLSGNGFVFSNFEIEYSFSDAAPTEDGFTISPGNQVTGTTGQTLWAKSSVFDIAQVFKNQEV